MPRGIINSNEKLICPTCASEFTKYHYRSKYCSDNCRPKTYKRDRTSYYNKEKTRHYNYKRLYGLDVETYYQMQKDQDYKCQICSSTPKVLQVDHCHSSGKIRGLLCQSCNTMLGHAKESIQILDAAKAYLEKDFNQVKESK